VLVLSRKPKEALIIEGVGTVTVQEIRNGRVSLGLDLRPDVKIRRSELPPHPKPQEADHGSR
jgi:carbon storage regulator CsrA